MDQKKAPGCVSSLIYFVVSHALVLWEAFVASKLWEIGAVKYFHLPPIGIVPMVCGLCGLYLLRYVLFFNGSKEQKTTEEMFSSAFMNAFFPGALLLTAVIVEKIAGS